MIRRERRQLARRVSVLESRLRRGVNSRAENVVQLRAILPALMSDDRQLGERQVGERRRRRARSLGWATRGYAREVRGFLDGTGCSEGRSARRG